MTVSSSASLPAQSNCSGMTQKTYTQHATAKVPKSTTRTYTPEERASWRFAPTEGKWSEIKKSNLIRMTAMQAGEIDVRNFLGAVNLPAIAGSVEVRGYGVCTPREDGSFYENRRIEASFANPKAFAETSYVEQGDYDYWKSKGVKHYHLIRPDGRPKRVDQHIAASFQELFQQYNLGEELWELRDSIATARDLVNKGALGLKELIRLFKENPKKNAESMWMLYRYGIMPIYYSISDVMSLSKSKGHVQTIRKRFDNAQGYTFQHPPPGEDIYMFDTGAVSEQWNVTVKGLWASTRLRKLDQVNLNPVTTAFTVYRLAFVVRWFVNVNAVLDARLKSLTTLATSYGGCVSRKTDLTVNTFLHHSGKVRAQASHVRSEYSSPSDNTWYWLYQKSLLPSSQIDETREWSVDVLLRETVESTYERVLISPDDATLVWGPYLDWKRSLDSLALLGKQTSKLLRALRV